MSRQSSHEIGEESFILGQNWKQKFCIKIINPKFESTQSMKERE
jgi:hypothetical protein